MKCAMVIAVLLTVGLVNCKPSSKDTISGKKVVCYYGSWAVYRPGAGKFPVEEIDPFLCTHLIYGFAGLGTDNKIRSLDSWNDFPNDYGKNAFGRFNNLKKINPNLKTILAIGGWNEGSVKYSNMAMNPSSRQVFVKSVVDFLQKYDFDGLDMDWEYPAARGGKPEDKQNFVSLLKELKAAFTPHGYLLTAATSAGKDTIDVAYDIPEVSKYLDFINLMCYDYHGGWETFTGHNSPLYALSTETPTQKLLNTNWSVNYWISLGAPREKIILGMGLYGRCFTLQRGENNGLYAPAPQAGQAGPYTREPGMLGYNEICEKFQKEKWNTVWVDDYQVPYTYRDRQWCGYDDQRSFKIKTDYVKQMGLGGAMVWSIETDDFHGKCHGEKYPLIKILHRELLGPVVYPPPTTTPPYTGPSTTGKLTTTSTTTTTTSKPVVFPDGKECTSEGWFRDPEDCSIYWRCYKGLNGLEIQVFQCDMGTVFDFQTNTCNWPNNVEGC